LDGLFFKRLHEDARHNGISKELLDGQWVRLQIPNCMHDWTLGSVDKLLLLLLLLENERRV